MPLVNQFQEEQLPTQIAPAERRLTAAEFQTLADVPPETEWFANIKNPHTKCAYKNAVADFMRFTGITRSEEFRIVTFIVASTPLPAAAVYVFAHDHPDARKAGFNVMLAVTPAGERIRLPGIRNATQH